MTQQEPVSRSNAETLLREGKTREALPLLLKLHQSEPGNSKVCLQLGMAYTQLQELEKAAEFYRKALRISPALVSARKNLATVLWFLNRKQESMQEFASVLRVLPNDPVAHFYFGVFQYDQKNFLEAKSHFEKAGDLAYKNPEALPMVVESYLAVKDTAVPTHLMKQLERAETPNPELVLQLGTLFRRYEIYDQCIKALETLVKLNSTKPEVYLMLGEAYDKRGMPEKAYSTFTQAIEIDPRSEEAYIAVSIFASEHHNNPFALKTLNQGLQKIPGSPKLLLQEGVIYALDGDLNLAESSFLKAAQADPRWHLPKLALGVSQLQAGKLGEAAETLRQAANNDPSDYQAQYLYALALIRAGAQGDAPRRNEVVSVLRKAVALNPTDPQCRVSLGQTYMAASRVDEAVAELEKALELDPKNPTALYQLGIAYRKQGKSAEAEPLLRAFEETKTKLREEEDQERKALVQILKTVR